LRTLRGSARELGRVRPRGGDVSSFGDVRSCSAARSLCHRYGRPERCGWREAVRATGRPAMEAPRGRDVAPSRPHASSESATIASLWAAGRSACGSDEACRYSPTYAANAVVRRESAAREGLCEAHEGRCGRARLARAARVSCARSIRSSRRSASVTQRRNVHGPPSPLQSRTCCGSRRPCGKSRGPCRRPSPARAHVCGREGVRSRSRGASGAGRLDLRLGCVCVSSSGRRDGRVSECGSTSERPRRTRPHPLATASSRATR
jgi:hypothetical protein